MTDDLPDKRYLGDGAYVAWDGHSFILTAEDGIRVTNRVVLDPEIYEALAQFVAEVRATVRRREP